ALEVLEHEGGHAVALLGLEQPQRGHDPAHGGLLLPEGAERSRGRVGPLRQLVLVALEWMAGDEEAERLLLVGEALPFRPVRDLRQPLRGARRPRLRRAEHAEEARLSLLAIPLL